MDGSEAIESLDTFWFFSNIFSSKPQISVSVGGDVETTQIDLKEPSQSKPIQIHVNQHKQYLPIGEILVRSSSACGEFSAETEQQLVKTEPIKVPEPSGPPQKKQERRRKGRKKRSFKGGFGQRRKILGEIDLGEVVEFSENNNNNTGFDDVNKVSGSCWIVEEKCGSEEKLGSQHQTIKMPPFKDGMAMKEHLKSWAYAVACTVR